MTDPARFVPSMFSDFGVLLVVLGILMNWAVPEPLPWLLFIGYAMKFIALAVTLLGLIGLFAWWTA